jgi:hypothetical protein
MNVLLRRAFATLLRRIHEPFLAQEKLAPGVNYDKI